MARPTLPVGTWGTIFVNPAPGGGFRARTRFRDFDGVTRYVERIGTTKGAARSALTASLVDRSAPSGDAINGESRLSEVAEVWFAERSDLAVNTVRRYRDALEDHILPGVGNLRVHEATVSRLDRFIKTTKENTGAPTAKLCSSVLSGIMALATRHGAIRANPMRDVAGVTVVRKEVRAMTMDEVHALRAGVEAWQAGHPIRPSGAPEKPRRGRPPTRDLLDLVDMFLATGVRIGELLAIRWGDIDLDAGTVTICGTIIQSDTKPSRPVRQAWAKGRKDKAPFTLLMPQFAIDVLLRRRVAMTAENVHDAVFPSTNGTLRDTGNVRKQLNKILVELGMEWVTPHTFRKTVATIIEHEADIGRASKQLNHGSTAVTARHYVPQMTIAPDSRDILDQFAPQSSKE